MVKAREMTPWGTTNAEYGRHLAAQAALKRASAIPPEAEVSASRRGSIDVRQTPTHAHPASSHAAPATGAGGGPQHQQQQQVPLHRLPPLDPHNYMTARDKPDVSWAMLSTLSGMPPPKTGLGKRFMREEMGRFWQNIQDVTGHAPSSAAALKTPDNVDVFRVDHEQQEQEMEGDVSGAGDELPAAAQQQTPACSKPATAQQAEQGSTTRPATQQHQQPAQTPPVMDHATEGQEESS